ncbi:uncharacterized protein AB675_10126 [Cyphellophora attinorum]|uniref:Acyltransferase 3 domain-containing protein n=1 Tax=Cyphellophora attinorum TaxID=1664694 RepID=A0A0N0NI89_9EURO|nr:uncharacterized protein AB675_10126 [Phialophora attinorum]KPI35159.1 hypothetical protein AB675_10126 [Phialophora attinorum]
MDIEAQQKIGAEEKSPRKTARNKPERPSTAFLDGLRGIAALCVFHQHLLGDNGQSNEYASYERYGIIRAAFLRLIYQGGPAAVAIFFVLSGFVLSQSALSTIGLAQWKQCRLQLLAAIVRRPVRLYLPCIAVALIIALLMRLPHNVYPDALWYNRQDTFWHEMKHFVKHSVDFFNPFQGFKCRITIITTLSCGQFLPIPKPYAAGALISVALVLLYKALWWQACFIAGVAIALIHSDTSGGSPTSWRSRVWVRSCLAYVVFGGGFYLLSQPADDGHQDISAQTTGWSFLTSLIPSNYDGANYYRFWQSCGAALCVLSLLYTGFLQTILCLRPIQFLGKVSFMLYIVHMPLFMCVGDRWRRALGNTPYMSEPKWWDSVLLVPEHGPGGIQLRWLVEWTSILALVLFTAHLGTSYIDEPSVRLSKRLADSVGLGRKKAT